MKPEKELYELRDEVTLLKLSLKVVTDSLNDLVASCLDDNGKPKAPNNKTLMKSRAMLPVGYTLSFKTKK